MKRIGITGGIGSGKTTFCKVWEDLGAYVLYADDFAKELMVSDQELIKKIKETFGKEAYQNDGSLNRPYLAKEAFEKGRVDELNGIVHPQLRKRIRELADKKEHEGVEVFAYEAAILLNEGRPEGLDYVVLLLAEDDTRVSRAAKRDKVDEQLILDRLEKQPNFEELSPLCDFLVMNDGSLKELQDKAKELYRFVNQIG
jgi:dephospho-CoA kinase